MTHMLDTHAWIWAAQGNRRLSPKVRALLAPAGIRWGLADISLWETCMLVEAGILQLSVPVTDFLDQALTNIQVLPITKAVAIRSAALAGFHGDPADRLIVATALEHGLTLVTKDRQIRDWRHVPVLW